VTGEKAGDQPGKPAGEAPDAAGDAALAGRERLSEQVARTGMFGT
jgi:hypothetical protein